MGNTESIKRRYLDLRNGQSITSPILQFSNFIMISYLAINEFLPIWLFAPIALVLMIIGMVSVGHIFRKKQLSTDMDLNYEKASAHALTTYHIMNAQKKIMDKLDLEYSDEFVNRINFMKRIADRNT